MRKFVTFLLAFLLVVGLVGCSSGVPQEEYDAVVSERDALSSNVQALEEKIQSYEPVSDALILSKEYFETINENISCSEYYSGSIKVLHISIYVDILQSTDWIDSAATEIGEKLVEAKLGEAGFDYDFVQIDALSTLGSITTMWVNCATMDSDHHSWMS